MFEKNQKKFPNTIGRIVVKGFVLNTFYNDCDLLAR